MKQILVSIFITFLSCSVFSQDYHSCYIEVESSGNQNPEYIIINKVGSEYFVSFLRPTISGRASLSRYWVGEWDGHDLILNNGYSTYAINMIEQGYIHYYSLNDSGEFPGKDFRPITEEDLKKIVELK
ncbi:MULTISPECIES: hypothetical protein [unclassified Oceanispirochaeta]|uniref:hypothetical protein n=1 Tax=unclassified Oceanispirochaeta TaxID=2635722 RepID=UPI000E09B2AC|nr:MULTISPECIES: hypothetical protein [unclassified Oceanispirochaeta]MBF9014484.1 hypothetical protein [Oceanispirochaeta sp. M2]NPD70740.1 hypothetical protein [Oceanispirochaeta sp. M1]RDG34021.1 hypothetical protein DV872_01390 [Oceanispirochaeta sp. M1]